MSERLTLAEEREVGILVAGVGCGATKADEGRARALIERGLLHGRESAEARAFDGLLPRFGRASD